jgi:hypothetical protein
MRRTLLLASAAWAIALGVGCTGNPISTSAQAGSTVVIPFAVDSAVGFGALAAVGLGGSQFDDPQRGKLVVHLGSSSGFALTTRLAFLASAPVESALGVRSAVGQNLLLMVDLPTNTPQGWHDLVLVRERTVNGAPELTVVTPYPATPQRLRVLPNQVQAGGTTVTGQPTPSEIWFNGVWNALVGTGPSGPFNYFGYVVPPPSFGVRVSTAGGGTPASAGARFIAYAQVEIDYPQGVINVQKVVSAEPQESLVSWSDDGDVITAWTLTKRFHDPFAPKNITSLGDLRVVFTLDAPSALLSLGDVSVELLDVRDQYGDPAIEPDWNLSAYTTAIR